MYQSLGNAELKTGEVVEIGVFTSPVEEEFRESLNKLLGHKGWEWVWQIGLSVDGKTDTLENRFYVARRGDDLISNVCTFECKGVGLLGHVWTPPEERRKGLCKNIFIKLMDDFRARGDGLMVLGTGFDTPPWHIYKRFDFVEYFDGSGLMRYSADDDFEKKYFAAGPAKVVEPTWSAYPRLDALAAEPEEFTKSVAYGKFGKTMLEDAYLYIMHGILEGEGVSAKLLESDATGAIVGYAWTVPDRRFRGTFLLDLYAQANHLDGHAKLLDAMTWPDAKVTTYVEAGLDVKMKALEAAGFEREGTLKGQLVKPDGAADMLVYSRNAG